MLDQHRSLAFLVKHGVWVALAGAIGVFTVVLLAVAKVDAPIVWLLVGAGAAAFCGYLLLVLRDIARVVAENLLPSL